MKAIFILKDNKIIEQFDSNKELRDYLSKIDQQTYEKETLCFSYDYLYKNPDFFIEFCTNKQLLEEIEGRMFDLQNEEKVSEEKSKEIEKIKIEFDNKDEVCKLVYMNRSYELKPQEVIMIDKIEELRETVNYLLKKEENK